MGPLGAWLDKDLEDPRVANLQVFRCRQMFLLVIPGVMAAPDTGG